MGRLTTDKNGVTREGMNVNVSRDVLNAFLTAMTRRNIRVLQEAVDDAMKRWAETDDVFVSSETSGLNLERFVKKSSGTTETLAGKDSVVYDLSHIALAAVDAVDATVSRTMADLRAALRGEQDHGTPGTKRAGNEQTIGEIAGDLMQEIQRLSARADRIAKGLQRARPANKQTKRDGDKAVSGR